MIRASIIGIGARHALRGQSPCLSSRVVAVGRSFPESRSSASRAPSWLGLSHQPPFPTRTVVGRRGANHLMNKRSSSTAPPSSSSRFPTYLYVIGGYVAGYFIGYHIRDLKEAYAPAPTLRHSAGELPTSLVKELRQLLGDRFVQDVDDRDDHGKDYSFHQMHSPHAVVYPLSEQEIQSVLMLCNEHAVPIVPYGSGSSLEGHTTAPHGGICVDLAHLNKVIAIHKDDLDVVVQPGVKREDLNAALEPHGLFFPVDPGPGASVGGMVSTNCSGTYAVRYGTMKENILNLRVALPSGKVISTGQRARKSSAGYDLTHLFCGSEGTLGIVTQVTLRVQPLPEKTAVARCEFKDVRCATQCVIDALHRGIRLGRVELLDELMVKGINKCTDLGLSETPTLLFEFIGTPEEVKEQHELMRKCSMKNGGSGFQYAEGSAAEELWSARKMCFWHSQSLGKPGGDILTTDVCVPISRLADCVELCKADAEEAGIVAPLLGHVGDGNFHMAILFDGEDQEEVMRVKELNRLIVKRAISMDGTCTGEHGVGSGKIEFMQDEFGADSVELMVNLKRTVDPNGIMNPGKLLPTLQ